MFLPNLLGGAGGLEASTLLSERVACRSMTKLLQRAEMILSFFYNNVDQGGLPAPTSLRRVSKNLRSRELPTNKKKHSNGDGPDFVMPRLK